MIDIYTEKIDSKDWIIKNDLFFNLNTSNEEMSDHEVALIKQVDDANIRFNDTDVVTGSAGYDAWWSKEYERREANDL